MKKRNGTLFFLGLVLICLLLPSCDRSLGSLGEEKAYPDLILHDASYAFGRTGDHPVTFEASEVIIYKESTVLTDVVFDSPEAYLSGSCDKVTVTEDNSFAVLEGNVKLDKSDDNVKIVCETMNWNNSSGEIKCDGEIEVTYGGGTYIRAEGFTGKTESNGYTFTKIIEGRYTDEK